MRLAAGINVHLVKYCEEKGITFTRSQAYKKNDNCYGEQKNYPVVRKLVGYRPYATEQEREPLQQLYSLAGLCMNFFQPGMKLGRKERRGSKGRKVYDEPRTPLERVLASPAVETKVKRKLRKRYTELDLVEIKRQMERGQEKLWRLQENKINCPKFRVDLCGRQPAPFGL